MDKEDVIYGYYSAIKKNEILPLATPCIDLEGVILSEVSQTEVNTVCFIYMWTLKTKQMNKHNNTETDSQTHGTN